MPINKLPEKKNGLSKYRVRVNYTSTDGKYHQIERTVFGLEQAKQMESRLLQEIKHGENISNTLSLQALVDEYANSQKYEIRESTLDKTLTILNKYVLPHFAQTKLNKLTVPALQKWKDEINSLGLALNTRKNIYAAFRGVLNYGVRLGYINTNPLSKIGNFKDVITLKQNIDYYTPKEFKKFIQAAHNRAKNKDGYEWNYYVFFNIAFYTGMRKGEIYALKWSDIKNERINITKSITQKLKGGDRETPPKNKSSIRELQIPTPLINILNEHKARMTRAPGFNDSWYICGGEICVRDTSITNRNIKYASDAGVKQIRIHDFRHSHASLLANEGINIQEIARRLGHSKIEITWNTYSHLYPREEERAIKILNKI